MKKLGLFLLVLYIPICAIAQEVRKHVVKQGETLISIANLYGITTSQIEEQNKGCIDNIFPGLILKIPSPASPPKEREQSKDPVKKVDSIDKDVIELKDGSFLECKVVRINNGWITLRQERFSSNNYRISIKDVDVIKYSNGTVKRIK